MTLEIGLIVASLLILFCAAAGVVAVSGLLYPVVARHLDRLAPATRASALIAWATAPVWASMVLLLLVLSPSIAHLFGIGVDHCHDHVHEVHLCVIHTPWVAGSTVEWMVLGVLAALTSAWLLATFARLRAARGTLKMLLSLSKPSNDVHAMRIVASRRHFVFTAGTLRPHIFVSDALLAAMRPCELATVVAHELAHQRRKDGLKLFLADALGGLHLLSVRRRMLADLHLAAEQACDEAAAGQSGDRLQVAETILRLTRLSGSQAPAVGDMDMAFTGADTVRRVEGMLQPPIPQRSTFLASVSILAAGLLVLAFASSDWWHHSAETLLGYLLG